MTEEQRTQIDQMSHVELARLWRHGRSDNPLLQKEAGCRVRDRLFTELGGFTPAVSKAIGW